MLKVVLLQKEIDQRNTMWRHSYTRWRGGRARNQLQTSSVDLWQVSDVAVLFLF